MNNGTYRERKELLKQENQLRRTTKLNNVDADVIYAFPFILGSGYQNNTEEGLKDNYANPGDYSFFERIYTGKDTLLAYWENAYKGNTFTEKMEYDIEQKLETHTIYLGETYIDTIFGIKSSEMSYSDFFNAVSSVNEIDGIIMKYKKAKTYTLTYTFNDVEHSQTFFSVNEPNFNQEDFRQYLIDNGYTEPAKTYMCELGYLCAEPGKDFIYCKVSEDSDFLRLWDLVFTDATGEYIATTELGVNFSDINKLINQYTIDETRYSDVYTYGYFIHKITFDENINASFDLSLQTVIDFNNPEQVDGLLLYLEKTTGFVLSDDKKYKLTTGKEYSIDNENIVISLDETIDVNDFSLFDYIRDKCNQQKYFSTNNFSWVYNSELDNIEVSDLEYHKTFTKEEMDAFVYTGGEVDGSTVFIVGEDKVYSFYKEWTDEEEVINVSQDFNTCVKFDMSVGRTIKGKVKDETESYDFGSDSSYDYYQAQTSSVNMTMRIERVENQQEITDEDELKLWLVPQITDKKLLTMKIKEVIRSPKNQNEVMGWIVEFENAQNKFKKSGTSIEDFVHFNIFGIGSGYAYPQVDNGVVSLNRNALIHKGCTHAELDVYGCAGIQDIALHGLHIYGNGLYDDGLVNLGGIQQPYENEDGTYSMKLYNPKPIFPFNLFSSTLNTLNRHSIPNSSLTMVRAIGKLEADYDYWNDSLTDRIKDTVQYKMEGFIDFCNGIDVSSSSDNTPIKTTANNFTTQSFICDYDNSPNCGQMTNENCHFDATIDKHVFIRQPNDVLWNSEDDANSGTVDFMKFTKDSPDAENYGFNHLNILSHFINTQYELPLSIGINLTKYIKDLPIVGKILSGITFRQWVGKSSVQDAGDYSVRQKDYPIFFFPTVGLSYGLAQMAGGKTPTTEPICSMEIVKEYTASKEMINVFSLASTITTSLCFNFCEYIYLKDANENDFLIDTLSLENDWYTTKEDDGRIKLHTKESWMKLNNLSIKNYYRSNEIGSEVKRYVIQAINFRMLSNSDFRILFYSEKDENTQPTNTIFSTTKMSNAKWTGNIRSIANVVSFNGINGLNINGNKTNYPSASYGQFISSENIPLSNFSFNQSDTGLDKWGPEQGEDIMPKDFNGITMGVAVKDATKDLAPFHRTINTSTNINWDSIKYELGFLKTDNINNIEDLKRLLKDFTFSFNNVKNMKWELETGFLPWNNRKHWNYTQTTIKIDEGFRAFNTNDKKISDWTTDGNSIYINPINYLQDAGCKIYGCRIYGDGSYSTYVENCYFGFWDTKITISVLIPNQITISFETSTGPVVEKRPTNQHHKFTTKYLALPTDNGTLNSYIKYDNIGIESVDIYKNT